jgi:hypothetical protein
MEKADNLFGFWINTTEIAGFMFVAREARQRQVLRDCFPAVFYGENVIDLERRFVNSLGNLTVFTPRVGATPNQSLKGGFH